MIRLLLLLTALCTTTDAHSSSRNDARIALKKWGVAYCLSQHVEGDSAPGGSAMGAYFEAGAHDNEEAYQNVRTFFDDWVQQHPMIPKHPGNDLSLMPCLDASESVNYRRVIEAQDTFLP